MISVSQLLSQLYPFDIEAIAARVAGRTSTSVESVKQSWLRSAEKGTIVHRWIEEATTIRFVQHAYNIILDYRFTDYEHDVYHQECVRLTNNAIRFIFRMKLKVRATECLLRTDQLSGCIDMIAYIPHFGITIIDWKTSSPGMSHTKYIDQLALYSYLYPEANTAMLVYLKGTDPEYYTFKCTDLRASPVIGHLEEHLS